MVLTWLIPLTGLAWLAGTALQLQQAALYAPVWGWVLLLGGAAGWIGAVVVLLRVVRRRGLVPGAAPDLAALLVLLAGAALGWACTEMRAQARLAERLAPALERVELEVVGIVADLPLRRSDGVRLRLEVESARLLDAAATPVRLPGQIALGWYADTRAARVGDGAVALMDPRQVRAGERWRLVVRLGAPHGLFNPGGFDQELRWFEQGTGATGTVRGQHAAQRLDTAAGYPVQRLRQSIRDAVQARLGDSRAAGVVAALCVGDQAGIAREDWELFRATGVSHLIAISGVHLTMLAWLAAALLRRAWPRSRRLALWLPAPHAARLAGVAVALGYAMLAGWGVPAQRTVFMVAVAAALPLAGLRWPWPLTLLAAAWVVVVLDPWALLQPGFWLSFVAVALLMLQGDPADTRPPLSRGRAADAPRWRRLLARLRHAGAAGVRTQAVATVGLAPLSLLFFHQIALLGFVANLMAIPLVTLLITPLVLLGVLLPALWNVAALLVDAQAAVLGLLAAWPLASWQPPAAALWAQLAALAGALLLLLPAPRALRLTGLPLLLPLLWPALPQPAEGEFALIGADVGQGQAVLVSTRTHTLLYDTGGQYSTESDAGERVLVPLLRRLGVAPLDLLVLSHRDTDHVGGARAVLAGVGALDLRSSLEVAHPLRLARPHTPCLAGQRWRWDGVDFEFLHPTERDYQRHAAGHLRPNGVSCVLRIDNGRRSALLTGDVEQPQEFDLLARSAPQLRADVLLVPHHGSRTSSDGLFLQAVAPRWGLVQAGHHNRYGHPAPEVVERLLMHGIEVVRTDFCGAWHWDSAHARPWCQRERDRRYWHAPSRGDGLELATSAFNHSP
jgi:competence protein ComEC